MDNNIVEEQENLKKDNKLMIIAIVVALILIGVVILLACINKGEDTKETNKGNDNPTGQDWSKDCCSCCPGKGESCIQSCCPCD